MRSPRPVGGASAGVGGGRGLDVEAERRGGGQHGERVQRDMPARHADPVGDACGPSRRPRPSTRRGRSRCAAPARRPARPRRRRRCGRPATRPAWAASRSKCGLSRGRIGDAAGHHAGEDLALRVRDARRAPGNARYGPARPWSRSRPRAAPCAVSGTISSAWFMPISNTPKAASRGMRASVSGTPQWLLKEAAAACVAPKRDRTRRSASLVPVLPTEPVTATIRARDRARLGAPRSPSAPSTSGTATSGPASANSAARSCADERGRGPGREGGADVVVPVLRDAPDREEEVARPDRARVDRDAPRRGRSGR